MYIYIFVYVFLVYFGGRRKIFEGKYLAHLRRIESWPRYRLGRATLRSILARGVSATPCRTVRETSTPRKGKSVSRIRGKTDILLNAITSDLISYPVLLLLNRTSPLVYLLLLYLVVDLSKTRANNGRIVSESSRNEEERRKSSAVGGTRRPLLVERLGERQKLEEGSPHQFKVERTKKKKKIYSGLGGRRERRSHGKGRRKSTAKWRSFLVSLLSSRGCAIATSLRSRKKQRSGKMEGKSKARDGSLRAIRRGRG